ncbi:hypothetical protein ACFYXJ_20025 [Streptomyces sp. NPDC002667]|uniref:hypothetical protein n=1 Tax=unclassified Streptomyces TaxID=2593676 RepID=UPI0030D5635D
MNDTSTMEAPVGDVHEASAAGSEGHGRHRGPVSGHDDEATPHGRHRKPSGQQATTA